MLRTGVVAIACALAGCELVTGIQEKTLVQADGGGNAGDDAGAADPSAPCAQQPGPFLYCDDFDSEMSPGDTWDWDLPMGGASLAFDTANYSSPPRSVQFLTAAGQQAQAQLGKNAPGLTSGMRLAFDLYVDLGSLDAIPEVGVAQVLCGALSVDYVLGPGNLAQAKVFPPNNGAATILTLRKPPLRTWTRIVLAYDASRGVSIEEDGESLAASTALAAGPPGDSKFIVGDVYSLASGSDPTVQFEIDNVVVRGN